MAYFKFVLSQRKSGSPFINIRWKNELCWYSSPRRFKKYYVAKLVSTSGGTSQIIASDYGVPVNRLDSHIEGTGGQIVINKIPGDYSAGSPEEITPREYTTQESQQPYSWKSTEFATCPVVNFGDSLKISFVPSVNSHIYGDFGYYDANGTFVRVGRFEDGVLQSGGQNYYVPPGHVPHNQYFTVDRQLMQEQNLRFNHSKSSLGGHVCFRQECIHIGLSGYGMRTINYRILDPQANVYKDWDRTRVTYIFEPGGGMVMTPKVCSCYDVPTGYTVEIYGTAMVGYSFSGSDLDGHTTQETALRIVYNGSYLILSARTSA